MHPFYFGTSAKSLFGIYHPPLAQADRETGVVLCNPFGSEYVNSHRALRQLALRLSRAGFHALRFDYYGSGDSAGESHEVDIDEWKRDIAMAAEELKKRGGLSKVSLVGLRLGSTLAALTARERGDVESLLLWEPILDGKGYIEELRSLHKAWLRDQLFPELRTTDQKKEPAEIIGFPLTERIQRSLESIQLSSLDRITAKHVLILRSRKVKSDLPLLESLRASGTTADYLEVATSDLWLQSDALDRVVVPNEVLGAMTTWMSEKHR